MLYVSMAGDAAHGTTELGIDLFYTHWSFSGVGYIPVYTPAVL